MCSVTGKILVFEAKLGPHEKFYPYRCKVLSDSEGEVYFEDEAGQRVGPYDFHSFRNLRDAGPIGKTAPRAAPAVPADMAAHERLQIYQAQQKAKEDQEAQHYAAHQDRSEIKAEVAAAKASIENTNKQVVDNQTAIYAGLQASSVSASEERTELAKKAAAREEEAMRQRTLLMQSTERARNEVAAGFTAITQAVQKQDATVGSSIRGIEQKMEQQHRSLSSERSATQSRLQRLDDQVTLLTQSLTTMDQRQQDALQRQQDVLQRMLAISSQPRPTEDPSRRLDFSATSQGHPGVPPATSATPSQPGATPQPGRMEELLSHMSRASGVVVCASEYQIDPELFQHLPVKYKFFSTDPHWAEWAGALRKFAQAYRSMADGTVSIKQFLTNLRGEVTLKGLQFQASDADKMCMVRAFDVGSMGMIWLAEMHVGYFSTKFERELLVLSRCAPEASSQRESTAWSSGERVPIVGLPPTVMVSRSRGAAAPAGSGPAPSKPADKGQSKPPNTPQTGGKQARF